MDEGKWTVHCSLARKIHRITRIPKTEEYEEPTADQVREILFNDKFPRLLPYMKRGDAVLDRMNVIEEVASFLSTRGGCRIVQPGDCRSIGRN